MLHFSKTLQESGKAFAAMNCTSSGRHTDFNFVDENTSNSILRNNEPDSMETDEKDLQPRKQEEPIISTVRGMTIAAKEEKTNAEDSILRNNEPDSIETDERDLQ
jgi:hypothetical protein